MATVIQLGSARCCRPPCRKTPRRAWHLLLGSGLLLVLGLACASTHLDPLSVSGGALQLEDDERRLWNRAREEQERLDKSGLIYTDALLQAYVNKVAQRLLSVDPSTQGLSIKVQVIHNPLLNAFAMPNGTIYIHTGLLARMENEAQLAALLGHEIAHVTNRHTLKHFRDLQNKAAFLNIFRITTLGAGAVVGGIGGVVGDLANLLGGLGTLASVYGYSRDLEREADLEGFTRLVASGYDVNEAPKLFGHLQRNLDPNAGKNEPFFFGTHPRLQERIDTYTELLQTQYQRESGETWRVRDSEAFSERTRHLLLDNAMLDFQIGRFNTAKAGIEKFLHQERAHPRALYLLGEVLRQQGTLESTSQAIQMYEEAMAHDPTFPDAYKGLGLLYYKQYKREQALPLFESYLTLAPEAGDREYIEIYLRSLKEGGRRR